MPSEKSPTGVPNPTLDSRPYASLLGQPAFSGTTSCPDSATVHAATEGNPDYRQSPKPAHTTLYDTS